jgi:hypothetical protein
MAVRGSCPSPLPVKALAADHGPEALRRSAQFDAAAGGRTGDMAGASWGALQRRADAATARIILRRWPGDSPHATALRAGRALGVHPSTVRRWLDGRASPPGRVVFALMIFEAMEGRIP